MARPRATQEHRQEIQRGIRDAAAEIYRTQGVSAISARSVALKAGVSVGSIYSYFGDLTGLMQSIWIERLERQDTDFRGVVRQHGDGLERLRALLSAYLKFGIENGDLYRGAFLVMKAAVEPRTGPAPLDATEFPVLLVETLIACQSTGQVIEGEPALLAQILWSGLHGCLALPTHVERRPFGSAEEIAGPMVEALIRAVTRSPDGGVSRSGGC